MTPESTRSERGRERIKQALRAILLERRLVDVTVSDVARAARMSRTTFYANYRNIGEVYEDLVLDFQRDIQTVPERLSCAACHGRSDTVPFCEKVRNAGEYAGVVGDPMFSNVWIDLVDSEARKDYIDRLRAAGVTDLQARALFQFQINGCLMVAQSPIADEGDWGEIQRILDAFIAGGLSSLGANFSVDE